MPQRLARLGLVCIAVASESGAASDANATAPMNYLESFGPHADRIVSLTWGLLVISIAVVIVFTGLVVWAVFRSRPAADHPEPHNVDPFWIFGNGLVATTLILIGSVVWTMITLAAVERPMKDPVLRIEVTGHQWWWKVRYVSDEPQKNFETANEIHIPTGGPVLITLASHDVIHSFWIPALGGKTDVIPGQLNETWIEADKPGTYVGQCAEYCGTQHAHMELRVVAEPPDKFEAWRNDEIKPAPEPQIAAAKNGLTAFESRCAACHTVRGTKAGGIFGPNLSHLMTRSAIAGGSIPNAPGYLAGWIADPQHIKPGTRMPQVALSGEELSAITAYLETLK